MTDAESNLSPLQRALLAVRTVKNRLDAVTCGPIAIVGMGCRFPGGADDVARFWERLCAGFDASVEMPADRWPIDAYYDADPNAPGKTYSRNVAALKDIDKFDAEFFRLSAREANALDPQHRLLLEVSWQALEHAGTIPAELNGTATGVFMGLATADYGCLPSEVDVYSATGVTPSAAVGRISYLLGLTGPALAVDTACSSSLVAVHLACQSLRSGECSLALAGGVNAILYADTTVRLSRLRALSAGGHCRTFDAAADGYLRGEGCGVVVLKRLADAERDDDRVLAIIRGSAVNQDGRSQGLTAPNGPAQQQVIRAALAQARISPDEVDYLEAHGTGTPLGDPIELHALDAVLREGRVDRPVLVGSVKTNIGHLEAAAGIAGLIKAVLVLQHSQVPPHLHFRSPNPNANWATLQVEVPTRQTPLPARGGPHIAAVSAFGFSGTNAHVVLQQSVLPTMPTRELASRPSVLALSAKSQWSLDELAGRYATWLEANPNVPLIDVVQSAVVLRSQWQNRVAVVGVDRNQIVARLRACSKGDVVGGAVRGQVQGPPPRVAFLFTGQGSQFPDMGKQLYEREPVFRAALDLCAELLAPHLQQGLLPTLYGTSEQQRLLEQTSYTQPALFALEWSLSELWRSWGLEPDAVLGHSIGEYVAATVAGVMSLEDGLRLVAARGRLMQALPSDGCMVSVGASCDEVEPFLDGLHDRVAIAAINARRNIVLSGDASLLSDVCRRLEAAGLETRRLAVSHAFHSPLMEPMLAAFENELKGVSLQRARISLASNLTGELAGDELLEATYWLRHLREPVQFAAGLRTLFDHGIHTFVELGPRPVLSTLGQLQEAAPQWVRWIASLRQQADDSECLATAAANLYCIGVALDWSTLTSGGRRADIPTYSFERNRYWLDSARPSEPTAADVDDWFYKVAWQPHALSPARDQSACGTWLVLAGSENEGSRLAEALTPLGAECIVVCRPDRDPWGAIDAPLAAHDDLKGIIHLWALDERLPNERDGSARGDDALSFGLQTALHLARQLPAREDAPRLWLVTRGAQQQGAETNPVQALLWGFGRVAALEHHAIWGGLIDIDGGDAATAAATIVGAGGDEEQFVVRNGQVYVPRLVRETDLAASASVRFDPDGLYLVTGGLSGIGLITARWLAECGVRHLLLTSRRGLGWPNDGDPRSRAAVDVLRELERMRVSVKIAAADASDLSALSTLVEAHAAPLTGIFHAAGVSTSTLIANLDADELRGVLQAKVQGSWALHRLAETHPVRHFVMYSSAAAIWAGAGQAAYAAANHYMDALSHYRQERGLPALSVNWGIWAEGGMTTPEVATYHARIGVEAMPTREALVALGRAIQSGKAQVTVAQVNWGRFRDVYTARSQRHLLDLLEASPSPLQVPVGHLGLDGCLRATSVELQQAALLQGLRLAIAAVFRVDVSRVVDGRLDAMGLDSILAIELRSILEASLGISVTPSVLWNAESAEALAETLLQIWREADLLRAVIADESGALTSHELEEVTI